MSKYVMLECNRLNGRRQVGGIDESQDTYKNKWTNNVNSSGIQINTGDTITCEASAINTIGAADSTLEYTGEENRNGYVDNKCSLSMAYYVNDSGFNMVKLPLVETKTSFGYVFRENPTKPIMEYLDNPQGIGANGVLNYLASRSMGEPNLDLFYFTFTEGKTPQLVNDLPETGLVYAIKLDPKGPGVNYRIGGTYNTRPLVGQNVGTITHVMLIDVLDVITETGFTDMPSKIRIRDPGVGYDYTLCPFNLYISAPVDGGQASNGLQQFTVQSYMNPNFKSKCSQGADGRRYYFGETGWSGPSLTQYEGQPANQNQGQDLEALQPNFRHRQTQIDLEVPIGLSTPDNLGTLITDQLHAPTRMTVERATDPSNNLGFDYNAFKVRSVLPDDQAAVIRPPVITTPTYTLFPSGSSYTHKNQRMNSLVGTRRQYYSVLGVDDPDKFAGLQFSRQLYYGLTNDIVKNQVNSGTHQRPSVGDFQNQTVGLLGMNQALMMAIPGDPANTKVKKLNKGDWVLTNQYFTEANVRKLSEGMKKCETYYDDLNEIVDPFSDKYKKGLAVAMDLGLYIDETSNAYPLTPPDKPLPDGVVYPLPNQRTRFRAMWETYEGSDNKGFKHVDEGNGLNSTTQLPNVDVCIGSIPFGGFVHRDGVEENDGQELSSIIFTARYDGDEVYNDSDIAQNYQNLYDIISQANDGTLFTVNGQSMRETFDRVYTDADPLIGTKSATDLIALAKKYDLAIIPVFPKASRTDEYKFGGRPYIAFKSHYDCGNNTTTKFNTSNPSRTNGLKWSIDSRNCPYGIQLGLDTSSIRNNLALCYNTNYATLGSGALDENNDINPFCPLLYMGAVNPSLNFNGTLSRFEWSGWNTPYTIGNGAPGSNQYILDATGNPEQQSYAVNQPQSVVDFVPGGLGTPMAVAGLANPIINSIKRGTCFWNQSNPISFLESLSGLSFLDLKLYDGNGDAYVMDYRGAMNKGIPYDNSENYYLYWQEDDLTDTLFGKMGFTLRQFLPIIGRSNSQFTNPLTFRTSTGIMKHELLRTPLPMTTGAYISSAEFQPTGTNSQDMPLYNLYPNMGLPSQPAVQQGTITAFNLPSKLDYPYMLIYSSVMTNGTDTEYYGGVDGKSKLPCIGYITRNYNSGDFFYSLEQGFNYTANKDFVITDIETELRLPNGLRPRLQPHSSVIYKITKPLQQLPPPSIDGPPSPKERAKRVPPKDGGEEDEDDEDEDE
tara:strand:- start:2344 stop:6021 length:3678 start_codon:yes stop_codon:yes gene_type:complete